jgi:hypothetical protein
MKLFAPASFLLAALVAPLAQAKLAPPSPEAQIKADEAKAKAAWSDKLSAYQLCKSMDRTADAYFKAVKAAGKAASAPTATPPCSDPGPFVAAAPAESKPLEASGAHSPPATASTPPSSNATQAELQRSKKK